MRAIIQRVTSASVKVENDTVGSIDKGYLILLGIGKEDNEEICDKMWKKISKLRIFEDENGKTNLDIHAVGGSVLLVSQFTLYANCKKGNRPSFVHAGAPDESKRLYEYFAGLVKDDLGDVQTGIFGADMAISLVNDGPFTIYLDSDELFK